MTLNLAVPRGFAAEAARICRVLDGMGVGFVIVAPDADAELRLESAEEHVRDAPPPPRAAILGLPEARDGFVGTPSASTSWDALPAAARIGLEGGLRRELLGVHRPDAVAVDVAHAEEALAALDRGEIDAWIAPVRVIRDAGAADRILEVLEPTSWMSAPGRGALLLSVVGGTELAPGVLATLDDDSARQALLAEAAVMDGLGAVPGAPVAVTARPHGPLLRVRALVPAAAGRRLVRADVSGRLDEAVEVGRRAARQLVARGALELLAPDMVAAS